jgi:murein DD-endopeptidase MepM/ murein hydrolase activator NlpD
VTIRTLNSILGYIDNNPRGLGDGYNPRILTVDQQKAFEKIKKIAQRMGSPSPSVTAAIAMHESGYLTSVLASQNNNPFGQTDGKGGFEIYKSLDDAVKAHVIRWKSSYIGKTPQEIIESIRSGKGKGAPGAYNVEDPNWAQKVLSVYQGAVEPQPSRITSAQFKSVLPEGNPQFSSGFGRRDVGWGSRNHQGIDIGVDRGSRVLSLSDGTARILNNATWGSFGQAVVIDHGDGTSTIYGHVDPVVKDGAKVKKGDVIAKVKYWPKGAYGAQNEDNTHLHLERRLGGVGFSGRAVDPSGFLQSVSPKSTPPQLGKVIRSVNIDGTIITEREGGKYFQNGKPISKDVFDAIKSNHSSAFGSQASLAPTKPNTGDIASLNYTPSYDDVGTTKIILVTLEKNSIG